ncbi:hypothetical protein RRG08_052923 [Elysia crispata]|uniref:Uncharacterized protein n=1 Tax=Elysia crispata TaxID=231223 RepID=A0AAE0YSD1_9GAST|nr:hypothetical protein RRG08_052923 [Elysia crispata]
MLESSRQTFRHFSAWCVYSSQRGLKAKFLRVPPLRFFLPLDFGQVTKLLAGGQLVGLSLNLRLSHGGTPLIPLTIDSAGFSLEVHLKIPYYGFLRQTQSGPTRTRL